MAKKEMEVLEHVEQSTINISGYQLKIYDLGLELRMLDIFLLDLGVFPPGSPLKGELGSTPKGCSPHLTF